MTNSISLVIQTNSTTGCSDLCSTFIGGGKKSEATSLLRDSRSSCSEVYSDAQASLCLFLPWNNAKEIEISILEVVGERQ